MSNISLTPDQIKSIAAEIRRTEAEKMGTKLPNTTALNAIARSLGLGPDFRTFKAKFDAQAATDCAAVLTSNLNIFVESDQDEPFCEDAFMVDISAMVSEAGFNWSIATGAHGFSQLMLSSTDQKHSEADIVSLKSRLLDHLQKLHDTHEVGKILGAIHWQSDQTDRKLIANFRYNDNDQVCSATISESAWKSRKMSGQSDEFCLLALSFDIEIEPEYTPSDITVEDIMVNVEFWYDA